MKPLQNQIVAKFNGAIVSNVAIDEEFGNVTATVNGVKNVDCGFVEDYEKVMKNGEMCYIPSGMGGVFPALILSQIADKAQVYCCSPDYFPLWLVTVKISDLKPWDGLATEKTLKLIAKAKKLAGVK